MKQTKKNEKSSLRKEWALIWRGVRIWNEILPGYWFIYILYIIAQTFSPYFGLYMSARIVNELVGSCDIKHLFILVFVTVAGEFLISMENRYLWGRWAMRSETVWQAMGEYMGNAQNGFQFEHLENAEVTLKRSKILADSQAFSGGMFRVLWSFPVVLQSFFDILFSVILSFSLFTMTAKEEYSGLLGFINSPLSALALLCIIGFIIVLNSWISKTSFAKQEEAVTPLAESNSLFFAYENLWGADMIVFGLNRIAIEEFRKYFLRPEWIGRKEKVEMKYNSYSIIAKSILNIAVFVYTAAKAFLGVFEIGSFVLYQGAITRFVEAVALFVANISQLIHNNRYLKEFYEYIDLPNDMYKGTLAVEKRDDIDYEIEFRDVSFKYPHTDTWALRHVNMKFKIGDKLAIVGENGSGKTTFIKLLCRLYDPTEGKILLNGIDITRYRYDEYMALFSVVFQDYMVFGFSLGDNVSSSIGYDEKKARDCLIRAGFGEKLKSLDAEKSASGKATLNLAVGREYDSEGIDLSGGEKQKVALARALYKDAPFVILDEPTAALDPIAEAAVYEDFNKIVQNKTSVFISHRLSSCRFCDTIAVFDHGQLVQTGSHNVLLQDVEGKYRQLWTAQAKYYES